MTEQYKILFSGGEGGIVEKKSRFIATSRPAGSEEEALCFIQEMRKKYWDASHNCYAYVIGDRGELNRCSDDGEPAQTAGRPILDVILGEEVRYACVVVTRYFGGTLLGTGGLVRAYQRAARAGLEAGEIMEKRAGRRISVSCGYSWAGKLKHMAAEQGMAILDSQYTDRVDFTFLVPQSQTEEAISQIIETTGAQAAVRDDGMVWYGLLGKEIRLLDS